MVLTNPQWTGVGELINSGRIGELRSITGFFSYFNRDPQNVRNQQEIGGGALMDIGCYPVVAARYIFDAEPKRVVALVDRDPKFKTDRFASVIADFGGGKQLSFVCGTQTVGQQKVELLGSKGRLEVLIPFNAPPDQRTAILVDFGEPFDGRPDDGLLLVTHVPILAGMGIEPCNGEARRLDPVVAL